MMSRHFGLSSELTGAISKRILHAKNQLSGPDSFFNQFVTYIYIYIYIYKRASLACAARLAVTLVNYKGDFISKYLSFKIDITRKNTKFVNF